LEGTRKQIRSYRAEDESAVLRLWELCGLTRPWNDPREDIARKLAEHPELFLVGLVDGRLVATAMGGYEGHRGWVNYLAVAPESRGRSAGRQLMEEVERLLTALGCPKLSLLVRRGNEGVLAFYRELGYAEDDVVAMGKRLIVDQPPVP
jgi:ribosomal protein S18 acetylase RimI-like enzyme